jgi:superfamily II DNA or RNA helicase
VKPRDFQLDALDGIRSAFERSQTALLVLPTGGGKTNVFAWWLQKMAPRHMVVAHREELIWQAQRRIEGICGWEVGVEMADWKTSEDDLYEPKRTVTSTVQTQIAGSGDAKRMASFDPMDFSALVVDEAHRAAAPSYRSVIDHYCQNPDLKCLGVTATPNRHDEKALGEIFGEIAYCMDYLDAARLGWLVPVRTRAARVEALDLTTVGVAGGEFKQEELQAVCKRDKVVYSTALIMKELEPKKTLAFCVGVQQAEALCDVLVSEGVKSEWVCGRTPKDQRRAMLKRFADGETTTVVNVGVLTEGFDDPSIERIVMARPTMSDGLYRQMMGRGTRTLPGVVDGLDEKDDRLDAIKTSSKSHLEVIDLVGTSRMGREPIVATDALAGDWSEEVTEEAARMAQDSDDVMDVEELLEKAHQKLDDEERLKREAEAKEARDRQQRLRHGIRVTGRVVIDDADSPSQIDRLMGTQGHRQRGFYRGRRPSEKMVAVLERAGIPHDEETTWEDAHRWIGKVVSRRTAGLASFKQVRALERFGWTPFDGRKLEKVTFEEASKTLDFLIKEAKGGRRRVTA